jgi:uncharacterized protein (DUF4415 family)
MRNEIFIDKESRRKLVEGRDSRPYQIAFEISAKCIERDAHIDYSDIPPLDKSFYKTATEVWPPAKRQLTIRLDSDVLKWLKAHGRGYQTRINRILRAAMESQPPRRSRSTPAPKKNTRSRSSLTPA